MPIKSLMRQTAALGTDFWNDSCDLKELSEALEHGAVGATSNPVIVATVVKSAPELWNPVIDRLIASHPTAGEDEIAWELIGDVGRKALELPRPEFERNGGHKGRLSLQVNPKKYRDAAAMTAQAEVFNKIGENLVSPESSHRRHYCGIKDGGHLGVWQWRVNLYHVRRGGARIARAY